ncbi:hypothetical protein BE21_58690 [Sorangium cellulosum]|uniref:Uncharacterized protein n=1 Tax=Sorangium cellulosum TaxID=56 RepID=A0A150U1L9_SORCE|nr:hypothetical protein BE21_58690 [Sorangium cellulosum]
MTKAEVGPRGVSGELSSACRRIREPCGEGACGQLQPDIVEAVQAEAVEAFGQHGALALRERSAEPLLELRRQRLDLPLLASLVA